MFIARAIYTCFPVVIQLFSELKSLCLQFGGDYDTLLPLNIFFYVLACNGEFCLILEKYFNITSKKMRLMLLILLFN